MLSTSLGKGVFFELILFFSFIVILPSCAPKKIILYDVSGIARNNLVATASELLGKPYRIGAKGPSAFDCSGFVYFVFKQSGFSLPITAETQGRVGREVDRDGALPGDLVFFKIDGDLHVGIVINGVEFVHASKSRGVAIDSVDTGYWRKRLIGYRSVL